MQEVLREVPVGVEEATQEAVRHIGEEINSASTLASMLEECCLIEVRTTLQTLIKMVLYVVKR